MRVYDDTQGNLYFLSPYCSVMRTEENQFMLVQNIFRSCIQLDCTQQQADDLLCNLKYGMTADALSAALYAIHPHVNIEQMIDAWIRAGVIE